MWLGWLFEGSLVENLGDVAEMNANGGEVVAIAERFCVRSRNCELGQAAR
jgi:hypothetical protein